MFSVLREELQVSNFNKKLQELQTMLDRTLKKDTRIQERPMKSGETNLLYTYVWVEPGKGGWRIPEGGTGSIFSLPCCEDDCDVKIILYITMIHIILQILTSSIFICIKFYFIKILSTYHCLFLIKFNHAAQIKKQSILQYY